MNCVARLKGAIGTPRESQILHAIYQDMPHRNFSLNLLHRIPDRVGVIEMNDVLWSNWERPERIVETLRFLGKAPVFPTDLLAQHPNHLHSKLQIKVG